MLQPIYRGKTYKFELEIKVNGIVADVSPDTVTLRLDTKTGVATPIIEVNANIGLGSASFELTPEQTALLVEQNYIVQVEWIVGYTAFLPPGNIVYTAYRKFIVLDEKVKIKPVIE